MTAAALAAALALLAASGAPPLTAQRAAELAVGADPRLSALRHRVEERAALRDAADRLDDPELRLQGLRSERLVAPAVNGTPYPAHPLDGVRVGLRWQPPGPGERGARRARADADAALAAADLAAHRAAVVARARALHATVLGLDAQLEVARAASEERERLRAAVGRRAGQGAATVLEESAAEVELLEARADVEALELRRRRAFAELLAAAGLPPGSAVALSAEDAARCAPPSGGAASPAGDDPRRRALHAELRATDAALSRSHLARLPWPTSAQLSYTVGDDLAAAWTLQVGISLPLPDGGRAERRALSLARARLEDEERARAGEILGELRRAEAERDAYATLARRRAEAGAVLEACLRHFDRDGAPVGLFEAGQLRARLLAARRAQLEAELACALGQIEVERVAGTAPGERRG